MENDEETFQLSFFVALSGCRPSLVPWEFRIVLQQGFNGRYFIRGERNVC